MRKLFFKIKSYIQYLLKGKHRKGNGVHSPFVFYFLNFVIFEKRPYYCYSRLEKQRRGMLADKSTLILPRIGTGVERLSSVSREARRSIKSRKYAQLLFRIASYVKAETVVELGTNLGLTTLYLASVNSKTHVYTFEASHMLCNYAHALFAHYHADGVVLSEGLIDECLPKVLSDVDHVDLAFIDANHTKESTLRYFDALSAKCSSHSIIVVDDIYWSEEMQQAWQEICQRPGVTLDIDLFQMGLIFFNKDLKRQSYIVAY